MLCGFVFGWCYVRIGSSCYEWGITWVASCYLIWNSCVFGLASTIPCWDYRSLHWKRLFIKPWYEFGALNKSRIYLRIIDCIQRDKSDMTFIPDSKVYFRNPASLVKVLRINEGTTVYNLIYLQEERKELTIFHCLYNYTILRIFWFILLQSKKTIRPLLRAYLHYSC